MKHYMISLKDRYFNKIIDGTKSFEFRRVFTKSLEKPFLCVIYVSSPIQAVCGIVYFDKPIKESIKKILKLAKEANYPFLKSVEEYFEGKEEGFVLPVKKAWAFKKPICLRELREVYPNFRPPQSFYCLENEQFLKLKEYVNNYELHNENQL